MALFVKRYANLPKLHYHKGEVERKGTGIPTAQLNKGGGKEIRERRKDDCTKMFLRLSVEFLMGITTGIIITLGHTSTRHLTQVTGGMGSYGVSNPGRGISE
jgi:hypothetical protein